MNRYGTLAEQHWQAVIPARYSTIGNPQELFSSLGEQVETRIQQMQEELEPASTPGQGYLDRVGTLNAVRMHSTTETEPTAAAEDPGAAVRAAFPSQTRPDLQPGSRYAQTAAAYTRANQNQHDQEPER